MHASIGSELSRERARDLVERERRVRPRHVRARRARHTRYPTPRVQV